MATQTLTSVSKKEKDAKSSSYVESEEAARIASSFSPSSFLRIRDLPECLNTGQSQGDLKQKQEMNRNSYRKRILGVKPNTPNYGMRLFKKFEYISSPYKPPLLLACDKSYIFSSSSNNKKIFLDGKAREKNSGNKSPYPVATSIGCSADDTFMKKDLAFLHGPFLQGKDKLQNLRIVGPRQLIELSQYIFSLLKKKYRKSNFKIQISDDQNMIQTTFERSSLPKMDLIPLEKYMNGLIRSDEVIRKHALYKAPRVWGSVSSEGSFIIYGFCFLCEARRQGIQLLVESNAGHYKKKEKLDIYDIFRKSTDWKS